MSDDARDDETLARVAASPNRVKVLSALHGNPKTPKQVADLAGLNLSSASRALIECREADAAELIVPEDTKRGRVHEITETGEWVLERLGEVSAE